MDLGKGLGLLTYSTLVHPGDTWDDMFHSLTKYVPRVKERVAPRESFGISLRLSNSSAETLVNDKSKREQLKKFLGERNIGCEIYYPVPLHMQKCFAHLGYKPGDMPHSEAAALETLALPIYPELTEEQIRHVANTVREFADS